MNPYLNNNPYFNPYFFNTQNQFNSPTNERILPPQQILQAKGKASIDALKMSANSSVLIADETAPIVWKCTSDSLGNVTAEPFDITPHKDEQQVMQENVNELILDLNKRLTELESKYEQSLIERTESNIVEVEPTKTNDARNKKPSNIFKSNDGKQSKYETN